MTMKILLSGYHNPRFPTITEYMENAIRCLGHDLVIFDDRRHIIPGRIRDRFGRLHKLDLDHLNRRLYALALEAGPRIAVITGGHRITADTIVKMKGLGIATVLWTIDSPANFQPILDAASSYDHIFCQGTEAIPLLEASGITGARWLPMACDPSLHHPVAVPDSEKARYAHEVAFVGSFYPSRTALFESIAHLDLAVWGPGWDRLDKRSPLKKCIRGLHTVPLEWLKIYSSAGIVLAPHYQDPQHRFPVHQASPRIFEAMACGAFVLTDNQRDVFALFKDGEHLVRFEDTPDFVHKIYYYLDHFDARMKIAEKGRQEVIRRHTYIHRIQELISIVQHEA